MNLRIKELADEAGLKWKEQPPHYTNTNNPIDFPVSANRDLEKFAELIVKECATYMNGRTEDWDAKLRWIFNDGSGYMEVDVDSLLNEHFGVEE
jgi:hypothetical protein